MKINKDTGISIGVLAIVAPIVIFLLTRASRSDVEVMKDRVVENEKVDIKQSMLIDNATKTLERINKQLDE